MKYSALYLLGLLSVSFSPALCAEEFEQVSERYKTAAFFAPPDSPEYRKYAPDRSFAVVNLAIDVTPDFSNRTIAATTTIKFKPIVTPLPELSLDAMDLRVSAVKSSEEILAYQVTDDRIIVTFNNPVPADKEAWVQVTYIAEPKKGIYFRTPEMGYKPGDTHLFSQGEATEARHWYPSPDSPNHKFTSEITCHVPEGMTVISNGRQVSETKDANGLMAVTWKQEKPHANYLISLVAGYFKKVEDKHRDVPLTFYTPPSEINEAKNSFRDTRDIMDFFEKDIGVHYPWPKYDQVVVNDFVAGGMENTSATTLTDTTLFTDATENLRDSESLVAHEMAHQWFGDYVTCKDWSHIWLNEGFATYYAHLYTGHKNGRDQMLYNLYHEARGMVNRTGENPRPIVDRKYNDPDEMFGYLAYDKGGWVLHMLRSQLGEDLYRQCIQTYLERHAFGSVVTEDLNRVVEELSGKSFDQFFDQWVYHAGAPDLQIDYSWDARAKLARITVTQNQKISEEVPLFNFPLPVRFKTKSGNVDQTMAVKQKSEDFYFTVEDAPTSVRIDPNLTVLARIKFDVSGSMLDAQLQNQEDLLGRLIAVDALSKRRDKDAVAKLKQALNNDKFYGVRADAARALRTIHNDDARDALLASTKQTDARVRRQVIEGITAFYHESAFNAQTAALREEKNPDIQALAIGQLGVYSKPAVRETLLRELNSTSYHNDVADAAIRGMRAANDAAFIEPLRKNLKEREAEFDSRGFSSALNTLAYLARDRERERPGVREFLLGYLNHPRRGTRIGAITALGTLEDPGAVAVLEKYTLAIRYDQEFNAATNALRKISSARRSDDALGDLRNNVLDLQKENSNLRKDLKALEKKLDALATPDDRKKKTTPPLKSPRTKT